MGAWPGGVGAWGGGGVGKASLNLIKITELSALRAIKRGVAGGGKGFIESQ